MMRALAIALAIQLASPCAAETQEPEHPATPNLDEITAHVTSRWINNWGPDFARTAGRDGQTARLVRVEGATCDLYSSYWPDCEITISAKFADGAVVTRTLYTMFDRDAQNNLIEVFVMAHPLRESLIDTRPVEVPPVN